jgi:hypothetical protein
MHHWNKLRHTSHGSLAGLAGHAGLPSHRNAITPFLTTEYHWVYTEFHGFKIICILRNLRDQREPKLSHNLAATLRTIVPSYHRTFLPTYLRTFTPFFHCAFAPLNLCAIIFTSISLLFLFLIQHIRICYEEFYLTFDRCLYCPVHLERQCTTC